MKAATKDSNAGEQEYEDDPGPPAGTNGLVICLAAGVFGLLLLLLGAGGVFLWLSFGKQPEEQVAQAIPPPGQAPVPAPDAVPGEPAKAFQPAQVEAIDPAKQQVHIGDAPAGAAPAGAAPGGVRGDAIPMETLAAIKAATVFIKVHSGRLSASGTGFLMRVDGNSALIVTNHHVVSPRQILLGGLRYRAPLQMVGQSTVTAVLHSGTKIEQTVPAEIVVSDAGKDLAILRISGIKNLPRPIDLMARPNLIETMAVFIFGFPFGEALSFNNGNPAVTVGRGSVSSIRADESGEVAGVQIDGALNPGNSGGPVVNAQGQLIGVAVATIKGAGIGLAIPPHKLTQLLNGRIGSVRLVKTKTELGKVAQQGEKWALDAMNSVRSVQTFMSQTTDHAAGATNGIQIEVQLVDPLRKIGSLAVHYMPMNGLLNPQQKNPKGLWQPLAPGQKLDLRIEGSKATVIVPMGAKPPNEDLIAFQFSYTTSTGEKVYTQPHGFHVNWKDMPIVAQNQNGAPARANSARANLKQATPAEVTQAIADIQTDNFFKRQQALDRLVVTQPNGQRDQVVKSLEPLLMDSNTFIKQKAIQAIGIWGGKDSVPALIKTLQTEDHFVRRAAIQALAELKDERGAGPIAQRLADGLDRHFASQALRSIGKAAQKAVIPYLEHADIFVRIEACNVLQTIGTEEAVPALQKAARDSNFLLRNAALGALRALGHAS